MDIQLPLVNLLPSRPEIRGISGLLAQLTPGQQIDAVVETHIGENYYLLRLSESGLQLRARTPLALEAGRSLTLQVVESGDTPKLKIVPPQPAAAERTEDQVIQQALREFLPKRQPATELATTLDRLLQSAPGSAAAKLPEPVRAAAAGLAQALPQPSRLADAEGLQQAVRDSGLFLEARLATALPAQARELATADVKGRLLVLVDALRKQLQETETAADGVPAETAELPDEYRPRAGPPHPAAAGVRPPVRQPGREAALQPAAPGAPAQAEAADAAPELRLAAAAEAPRPQGEGVPAQPVPARAETAGRDGAVAAPAVQPPGKESVPATAAEPPAQQPSPPAGEARGRESSQAAARDSPGRESPPAAPAPRPETPAIPSAKLPQAVPAAPQQSVPETPPAAARPAVTTAAAQPPPPSGEPAAGPGAAGKPPDRGRAPFPESTPAGPPPLATARPDAVKPQALVSVLKSLFGLNLPPEPAAAPAPSAVLPETAGEPVPPARQGPVPEEQEPRPHKPQFPADAVQPSRLASAAGEVPLQPAELKLLLHKAEGALAGIVMDQLASLPQSDGRQTVWQLEIPYVLGDRADALKLKVVREGKRGAPPLQCFWSVTLELHPPGLGTVNARISLTAGNIDSYFWSDRPETAQAIQSHLDLLAARLQHAGLSVGRLDTLPSAPAGGADSRPGGGTLLLDEKA